MSLPCFYAHYVFGDPHSAKNSLLSLPPPLPPFCPSSEFISNCSLMGCQENCAVTPGGPACYCKSGYEISTDGKTCKGEFLYSLTALWPGQELYVVKAYNQEVPVEKNSR